jgi:site-specific recombinase XerD
LDGWLVRRECKRLVASEADALRLDRLYADAFDAANGRFVGGLSACPRIIEALDDYVAHLRVERANQKVHLQAVRKRLERFARELSNGAGDVSVDKIAASDVKAWREKRLGEKGKRGRYWRVGTVSREVVNAEVGTLKGFAHWLVEEHKCKPDIELFSLKPLFLPNRLQGHRNVPKSMTVKRFVEITTALHVKSIHIEQVLWGVLLLGVRPKALFAIEKHDIEWPSSVGSGRIRLPASKHGVAGEIPIAYRSSLHKLLRGAEANRPSYVKASAMFVSKRGKPWTTQTFDHALAWAQAEAGIREPITAYDVRHAAITWLAQGALPQVVIQHYAGHLNLQSQEPYRHTTGIEAAPAYEHLEQMFRPKKEAKKGESAKRQNQDVPAIMYNMAE